MSVSYGEIGRVCATFAQGTGVVKDQVCKISASGEVAKCSAGDKFCGVAVSPRGNHVGVVVGGFVTVPYTGTAPTVGFATLAANGTGGVKVDATNGRQILVVSVDTAALTVTMYL